VGFVVTGVVLVAVGGAVGAVCRHLFDVAFGPRTGHGPSSGILLANTAGSLAAGLVAGWVTGNTLDPDLRRLVVFGFLGAFTTFSTLMMELVNLLEGDGPRHGPWPALGWGAVSVVGGVAAAALGFAVASGR
jgi:CrcB protein